MKKLQRVVLSFCLVLSLLFYPNVETNAASVSLGVSESTINIGDKVTVTITVPESVSATVDLTFSSKVLKFESASADVGTNGSTITMNVGKYSLAATNSISVTFKAKTSGKAKLSASVVSAVDNETAEEVSLDGASTSITVENAASEDTTPPSDDATTPPSDDTTTQPDNTPKSPDNSLSVLRLSSGTLSPSFKYNVTKYTAKVGYDVTSVVVSAKASNEKATIESVTGNGNVKLEVGENTIQVVVQAENGVKATYTIIVTREAQGDGADTPTPPEDDASESESEEETPDDSEKSALQWNGQNLQPVAQIPEAIIPADFTANSVMINSVETPCLTFANADLKVLYLANEEGEENLYVYDETQQIVYPFVKFESENNYVIVLLPDADNVPAPENYKECTLSIEGKGVISAYQFVQPQTETEQTGWFGPDTYYAAEPVASDFYLVYCMNNAGESGWYVYDSVEGTIQRFLGSVHNPVIESGAQTEDTLEDTNSEDIDALTAQLKKAENMQMIILCVAIFVVVVLVIIIVNLILRSRSDDDEFDEEDDEYEDEEDDEYEFDEDEDTTQEVESNSAADDEIEIEFYEMPQEENVVEDDEIEIEFYEMPQEENVVEDDEIEIEFYEMPKEETNNDDEVEVEFYDMEELLMKEAIASEKEESKKEEKIPVKNPVIYADDDDDDLEFIELD